MTTAVPRVWLTTLGRAKNQVDSEKLISVGDAGYEDAAAPEAADVVMVNTCAFIDDARRESIETILGLAAVKRLDAKLVVLGCMAQRYETELAVSLPEADAVIALDRYPELVSRLDLLDDVEELAEFLRVARLDWAGFFPFSPEAGTPAVELPDRAPADVAAERQRCLTDVQSEITAAANAAQVGRVVPVLVDIVEDEVPVARSHRPSLRDRRRHPPRRRDTRQLVPREVTGAFETDLEAEVVEDGAR